MKVNVTLTYYIIYNIHNITNIMYLWALVTGYLYIVYIDRITINDCNKFSRVIGKLIRHTYI